MRPMRLVRKIIAGPEIRDINRPAAFEAVRVSIDCYPLTTDGLQWQVLNHQMGQE